jgi:hypothetical protein
MYFFISKGHDLGGFPNELKWGEIR